ncbi:MAG: hypothetical protein WDW36_003914 [Sanguina aurantia]
MIMQSHEVFDASSEELQAELRGITQVLKGNVFSGERGRSHRTLCKLATTSPSPTRHLCRLAPQHTQHSPQQQQQQRQALED